MWFLDFVTVFNQSYNCQTSHYLGRNWLPEPLLLLLSLGEAESTVPCSQFEKTTKISSLDPIQKRALSRSVQLEAVYFEALLYILINIFGFPWMETPKL